jgi:hypothetical protein
LEFQYFKKCLQSNILSVIIKTLISLIYNPNWKIKKKTITIEE